MARARRPAPGVGRAVELAWSRRRVDPSTGQMLKEGRTKEALGEYHASPVAADGKGMRRALEQSHVDLIVLDLMLPGEDGLKLTRELRASVRQFSTS